MKRLFLTYAPLLLSWFVSQFMAAFRVLKLDQRGAILTAPLFSFGARGKLANALVYFPWKGLDVVRSYVVPANPQTASQTTQRGYMTSAVAQWHTASYTASDISAWNRLANLAARARSGFNRMVQEYITEVLLGSTWEGLDDGSAWNIGDTNFDVGVNKTSAGNAPYCRYGLTPTNMPNSIVLEDQTGNYWAIAITGLTPNTLYYYTFDVGASEADWGRTGIYTQRTLA